MQFNHPFHWQNPFHFNEQLTDEEKHIQQQARNYANHVCCQGLLRAITTKP